MSILLIIFYFLSAITLATALLTIISKNPIHSAIYLVICFFSVAGHYLLFNAQFLAIVHIIVYSGAIMVLFLFTIMLMNLNEEGEPHKIMATKLAAVVSFGLVCFVMLAVFIKAMPKMETYRASGQDFQSIKVLGKVLLNEYMVPFEFASILLLVAMMGVVLLSKKEKKFNKMNNILVEIGIENYIYLCVVLFCIGIFGVLYRRNAIIMFMSIEIMLNAVNLLFVAFSTFHQDAQGQVFVFFSMAVAAAEVAVGLAILVSIYRNLSSIDIDNLKNLKG